MTVPPSASLQVSGVRGTVSEERILSAEGSEETHFQKVLVTHSGRLSPGVMEDHTLESGKLLFI